VRDLKKFINFNGIMGPIRNIALISILLISSACRKDIGRLKNETVDSDSIASINVDTDTADFRCLPLDSMPSIWKDTTTNEANNVRFWQYNPSNINEIIYIANVAQLWIYDRTNSIRKHLADNVMFFPSVNRSGWIAFGTLNFQIFKIKTNGDSLTLLSSSGGVEPKWDRSDTMLYYFKESASPNPNQLIKINSYGNLINSYDIGSRGTGFSKISNKIAYLKYDSKNLLAAFQKELPNSNDQFLINTSSSSITFDNSDQFLFFDNDAGISVFNSTTKKLEIIAKNCINYQFGSSTVAPGIDKLTFVWHRLKPLPKRRLYHEFRCFEVDLKDPSLRMKEVKWLK
jgi:hypothetical protein